MSADEPDVMMLQRQLDQHIEHCEKRFSEGQEQMDELIECTRRNTEAVNGLVGETAGLVKVYNDLAGVMRIGVTVQKIGLWIIKWPLIGAGLYTIWKWISANTGSGQ